MTLAAHLIAKGLQTSADAPKKDEAKPEAKKDEEKKAMDARIKIATDQAIADERKNQ